MTGSEKIIRACQARGITLKPHQGDQLSAYMAGLLEINRSVNLTRIVGEEDFIEKNIVDSLMLTLQEVPAPDKILDLGTGGGFPGVPLAIYYPQARISLVDGTAKKLRAVAGLCEKIGLSNVAVFHARGEVLAHDKNHRHQYDWVTARAVANMAILAEICLPFLRRGGVFFAMKGENYQEELALAKKSLALNGGRIEAISPYFLLQREVLHVIIRVVKEENTPAPYPRPFKKIKDQYGSVL